MIRLCVDARMIFSSGIGTCIRNLLPFFSQPPFELSLLVGREFSLSNFRNTLFDCPIYSLSEQFYFPWKIPSCDVFWSPHYNVPILPIRSKNRVVTIHDVCHIALPQFLSRPKRMFARLLLEGACRKSQRVITVSEFSKSEIIRHLNHPSDSIDVIYSGIDRGVFHPFSIEEQSNLREKYALDLPFFFFIGNLKPHKNVSLLIKAFELLIERFHIPCNLVLGGKSLGLKSVDSAIQELIQKSPAKKYIALLGEVPDQDLPLFYASAEAFVFPSLYEGFGLPPLEAMACGCPVLASNAASIPEACGDAALFFSPHSAEELMHCMHRILMEKKLRNDLILKGLNRVQRFSWKNTATAYRQLFEEL